MQLLLFLRLWAVAELGSAIPEAGGGYLWVREGLGLLILLLVDGWMAWLAHIIAGRIFRLLTL